MADNEEKVTAEETEAKVEETEAKVEETEAKVEETEVKAEEAEVKAEAPVEEAPAKKKGLSKGALIGIIAAGVVVLAAAIVFGLSFIFSSGAVKAYNLKNYKTAYEKITFPLAGLTANADSVQQIKYSYAVKQLAGKDGKYYEASKILNALTEEGYSKKKIDEAYKTQGLDLCRVGNLAVAGKFEQDNDNSNGPEDIEWIVLEVKETSQGPMALLMTKNNVGSVLRWTSDGNIKNGDYSYENSELAAWCEFDFYKTVIQDSPLIKKNTPGVKVSTEKVSAEALDCGNPTAVHSFLLSVQEIQKYYANATLKPLIDETENSAKAKFDGLTNTGFWLRNAGVKEKTGCGFIKGEIDTSYSTTKQLGLRPCIWIKLG